jgi:anti-sigma factor RsiW
MSELFETAHAPCGDPEALITYVYGEGTEAERAAMTTHLLRCASCADEVAALGSTRQQLAAWTPPESVLGFQIPVSPKPLTGQGGAQRRPAAWWNRPLPAWAQAAAAALIFGAGLWIGTARGAQPGAAAVAGAPRVTATPVAATTTVSRDDLARLEQRLASQLAQARTAGGTQAAAQDTPTLQQVRTLIAESEKRQREQLDYRTAVIVDDFAKMRNYDLSRIDVRLGRTSGMVISNQRDINSLAQQVGLPGVSPYVP